MSVSAATSSTTLGFFTVVDRKEQGLIGGYLLLNRSGRPLEFHCTAPVKPNRAQQILYGATLTPFLYGEQIGRTLVEKGKSQPAVVCTDMQDAMTLGDVIKPLVVLVELDEKTIPPATADMPQINAYRVDRPQAPGLSKFHLAGIQLSVRSENNREPVEAELGEFVAQFDLTEPFERIREAISEAAP